MVVRPRDSPSLTREPLDLRESRALRLHYVPLSRYGRRQRVACNRFDRTERKVFNF